MSNLGHVRASFGAIVNSPQAGILAVGAISDKPVVKDGEIGPGKVAGEGVGCRT